MRHRLSDLSTYGLTAQEREMSTPPTVLSGYGTLYVPRLSLGLGFSMGAEVRDRDLGGGAGVRGSKRPAFQLDPVSVSQLTTNWSLNGRHRLGSHHKTVPRLLRWRLRLVTGNPFNPSRVSIWE